MDISKITIAPSAAHTHTVIFLHGRGDSAQNLVSSLDYSPDSRGRSLTAALPSIRWVFPQAPLRRCASHPDTIFQWFDVWDVRDFSSREELQAEGLQEVIPAIRRIIADEATLLGGRWDRVVLAGISMGGATGAHVLMNLDVPPGGGGRLGAFLGFSCRCPFVGRTLAEMRALLGVEDAPTGDEVMRATPVLLEHCADDPLVLVQNGRLMRDTLKGFGAMVEWREYPDGGHWFNAPEGIDDVVGFLERVLLGEQSYRGRTDAGAMDFS